MYVTNTNPVFYRKRLANELANIKTSLAKKTANLTGVETPVAQNEQLVTQEHDNTGDETPPPQETSTKSPLNSLVVARSKYDEKRRQSSSSGVTRYQDSPTSTISSSQDSSIYFEFNPQSKAAKAATDEFLPKTGDMIDAERDGDFGEFNKLSAFDPVVLYYPSKIIDSLKLDNQLLNIDNLFNDVLKSSSSSIMVKYYYKTLTMYQNCQNDQVQTIVDKLDQLTDKYDINYDNYFWLAINIFKKELLDPEIPYLFLIMVYFNHHYNNPIKKFDESIKKFDKSTYEVLESDNEDQSSINDSPRSRSESFDSSGASAPGSPLLASFDSSQQSNQDASSSVSGQPSEDDDDTKALEIFILLIENYRVEENYKEFENYTEMLLKLFEPVSANTSVSSAEVIPENPMDIITITNQEGGEDGEGGSEMAVVPVIDNCQKFNAEVNSPKYAFVSVLSEIFHDFIPSRCDIDSRLLKTITDKYNELIATIGDETQSTTIKLQGIANAPNIESNYFNALASEQMAACDSSNISYDKFTFLTIKTSASQTEEEYDSQIAILTNLAKNYDGYMILPKAEDTIPDYDPKVRSILDLHLYIYSPNYFPDPLTNALDNATSRKLINLTDMSPVHDELAHQYNKSDLYANNPYKKPKDQSDTISDPLPDLLGYLREKKDAINVTKTKNNGILPAADYHKKHEINSIAGILDSCGSAQPLQGEFLLQPDGVYKNLMSPLSASASAASNSASASTSPITDADKKRDIDVQLADISNECMSKMLSIWATIGITRHTLVQQAGVNKAKGAIFYAQKADVEISFELHSRDTTVANVSDCIMYCDNVFKNYGTPIVLATMETIANHAADTNLIFSRLIKATAFIMTFCTDNGTDFSVKGFVIVFNQLFFMVLAFLKSCGDKYQILTCNGVKEKFKNNICMFYTKDKLCALGALVSNTSFTSSFILGQELTAQIDLISGGDQGADACPAPSLVKLRSSTDTGYLTNERDLFFSMPDFAKLNENILQIIMLKLTGTDYNPNPNSGSSAVTPESLIIYPEGNPQGTSMTEEMSKKKTEAWEKTKFNIHKNLLSALKYYDPAPANTSSSSSSSSSSMETVVDTSPAIIVKQPSVADLIDAEIKQAVYANLNEHNVNFLKAAGKRIASVTSLYNTMFEYINQSNLTSGLRMAYLSAANIVKDRINALKTVLENSIQNGNTKNDIIDYHTVLIRQIDNNIKEFNDNAISELNENINTINKYGTRDRPSRSTDAKAAKNQEADIVAKIGEQRIKNKVQAALNTAASFASGLAAAAGKRAAKLLKKAQDTVEKHALDTRQEISLELEVKTIKKMKTTLQTFEKIKSLFTPTAPIAQIAPNEGGYLRKNKSKKRTTVKKYKKRVKKYTIKKFKKNATNNLKRTTKHRKKYKKRTTIRS